MSKTVVASIAAVALTPQRLVGHVSESDGMVTIEYKEPGMVKSTTRTYKADELPAYLTGEAGFVIALSNDPIAKFVGTLATTKKGRQVVKTEGGLVVVNSNPSVHMTLTEVDESSKEAKAAARASKVKVRGVKSSAKGEKKSKKGKKSKDGAPAPKKKKKKRSE